MNKHGNVSRNEGHYLFQYPHILSVGLKTETVYPRVGNILKINNDFIASHKYKISTFVFSSTKLSHANYL